jgi:O-antigen/teichoic acid export membrane protein
VFDSALWANQRFDQINAVNIITDLLRVGGMFLCLALGHGLVALIFVATASLVVNASLKATLSFRQNPEMVIRPRYFRRESVRELFSFGLSSFMNSVGSRLSSFLTDAFAAHYLALAAVTALSIAEGLVGYATGLIGDAAGVFTPVATQFHARNDLERQQNLAITTGRYMFALSLYFFIGFVFLGEPFIVRWMGPSYANVETILVILAAGALFAVAQSVIANIILSMAKHRMLAYFRILGALLLTLASFMLLRYGLTGLSVARAVFIGAFPGLVGAVYGCHLLHLPLRRYLARMLVRPTLTAIAPAAVLWGLVTLHRPTTWAGILLMGAAYSAVYAGACIHWVGLRQAGELVRGVLGLRAEAGRAG